MTANVSNVRDSVRRIEAELIETGSGLDFERSYVQLWRTEAERFPTETHLIDGALLWWHLDSPLATGEVKGKSLDRDILACLRINRARVLISLPPVQPSNCVVPIVVVGGTVGDGVDTMTLKLIAPLLTDGSDDGVYTITVQPVDQRGVNGECGNSR